MAKQIIGDVISIAGNKTLVVSTMSHKTHPLYRKAYINSKRYLAHDEKNEAKVGDRVVIVESKPISARKHFMLSAVIDHSELGLEDMTALKAEQPKPKESKTDKTEKQS